MLRTVAGPCCAIRKLVGCGLFICNPGHRQRLQRAGCHPRLLQGLRQRRSPTSSNQGRPGDIAECYADPTKAKNELGWVAEYGIEEMCADSWNGRRTTPWAIHSCEVTCKKQNTASFVAEEDAVFLCETPSVKTYGL